MSFTSRIKVGGTEETLEKANEQHVDAIRDCLHAHNVTRIYVNSFNWIQAEKISSSRNFCITWMQEEKMSVLQRGLAATELILRQYRRGRLAELKELPWREWTPEKVIPAPENLPPPIEIELGEGGEFIYVLTNDSMPGMVKIGRTDRAPEERARELSSHTGVPTGYSVYRYYRVPDSLVAERLIHERLIAYRVALNREFFQIDPDLACAAIEELFKPAPLPTRSLDEADELLAQATRLAVGQDHIWPGLLSGILRISYEEAEVLIQKLVGMGLVDQKGNVRREWAPRI